MARRNAARKREIMPDAILGSEVVTKLINCVMKDGKKSIAEGIVYGALNTVAARGLPESDALQVLKIA
jgi:small subunit ribosomal protein S7